MARLATNITFFISSRQRQTDNMPKTKSKATREGNDFQDMQLVLSEDEVGYSGKMFILYGSIVQFRYLAQEMLFSFPGHLLNQEPWRAGRA